MAALDNTLDVSEAFRKSGVKGAQNTLPIVPGVFPVAVVSDLKDHVSQPKYSRAFVSDYQAVAIGAQRYWSIGGPNGFVVERIHCHATMAGLLWYAGVVSAPVPAPNRWPTNVGTENSTIAMNTSLTPPALGPAFGRGNEIHTNLEWYVPAGKYLLVTHSQWVVAMTVFPFFQWRDLHPAPAQA